jgi:hypothetical protein
MGTFVPTERRYVQYVYKSSTNIAGIRSFAAWHTIGRIVLVVKIEVWPGGNKAGRRVIEVAAIVNDGTGSKLVGNYDCVILTGSKGKVTNACKVKGHSRSKGAWVLLKKALEQML